MVVLTAIMGAFSILSSWSEQQESQGAYHFNLLWIIAGVMGIFTAVDLFLFFFFWEMMLIPMYFLIANWGTKGQVTVSMLMQRQNSLSIRKSAV